MSNVGQEASIYDRFMRVFNKEIDGDIVVGDCLNVMRQMPDRCVDLVVTSPPYADMVKYGNNALIGTGEYPEWLLDKLSSLKLCCKPTAAVALNIRDKVEGGFISPYVMQSVLGLIESGWPLWDTWFWVKGAVPTTLATQKKRVMPLVEYVFIFCRQQPYFNADAIRRPYAPSTLARYKSVYHAKTSKHFHKDKKVKPNPDGALPANVWVYHTNKGVPSFPAPMSQELAEDIISALSKKGGVVFDPFMGSGTTAIAAKNLGRHYFGCDINLDYVRMANERVAQVDGTQLELIP